MSIEAIYITTLGIGVLAQTVFALFVVINYWRGVTGRALMLVAAAQLGFVAAGALTGASYLAATLEVLIAFTWTFMFMRVLGLGLDNYRAENRRWQTMLFAIAACLAIGSITYLALQTPSWTAPAYADHRTVFFLQLLVAIVSLVTLEQVSRNVIQTHRWKLRYLNLSAALLFGFAVVHHAYGLLMGSHSVTLLILQPIILAFSALMAGIASLRNKANKLAVNLSREFVFRSGVLFAIGIYLTLTGMAGYYVTLFDAEWGQVVAALLVTVSLLGLAIVIGSAPVRRYLRVLMARNFFEYKYDYREEWLKVTRELTTPNQDASLPQRAIKILAELVNSTGGTAWWRSETDVLLPLAELQSGWHTPLTAASSKALLAFFAERPWIIDLKEYSERPSAYPELTLGDDVAQLTPARFIIPLLAENEALGVIIVREPAIDLRLMWEDYDILKVVARQAAGIIALNQAGQTIAESKHFHAYNQLSAFLVHDLKTVTAQLSLLLENAEKHKANPAFIDDMLATTSNAVSRMNKLLVQLRSRDDSAPPGTVDVGSVARVVAERFSGLRRIPVTIDVPTGSQVLIDRDELESALGHILQNALDATPDPGTVEVAVSVTNSWVELLVKDTGCGMSRTFIETELFQPFRSTKGVSGMGIGVYQARQMVRSNGGDLLVDSREGEGTVFRFLLPRLASITHQGTNGGESAATV